MDLKLSQDGFLNVEIYGDVHKLMRPRVKHVRALQNKTKALSEDDVEQQFDVMKAWMVELGLPEVVIDDMMIDDFITLVETLSGQKKN